MRIARRATPRTRCRESWGWREENCRLPELRREPAIRTPLYSAQQDTGQLSHACGVATPELHSESSENDHRLFPPEGAPTRFRDIPHKPCVAESCAPAWSRHSYSLPNGENLQGRRETPPSVRQAH